MGKQHGTTSHFLVKSCGAESGASCPLGRRGYSYRAAGTTSGRAAPEAFSRGVLGREFNKCLHIILLELAALLYSTYFRCYVRRKRDLLVGHAHAKAIDISPRELQSLRVLHELARSDAGARSGGRRFRAPQSRVATRFAHDR